MQSVQVKHPYVTRHKGTSGGKPIIKGTRIRVAQIAVEYERLGWTPDEIVQSHPHLSLSQVHDALSYYYEHASQINADLVDNEQFIKELRARAPRSVLEDKRERD